MEAKATLWKSALEVLDKDNYISWSVRMKTYLMAEDLWDVIDLATESHKEEDDEATRRAKSKKNFMALHVIQNSCGPESFYKIWKISSSKIAWYTLAEIYNNMPKNANSAIPIILNEDNYEHWSAQVKAYLISQDLLDTIEATIEPPKQEDDEYAFKAWSKKNFLALHVIQNSCGSIAFSKIEEISLAKVAWDTFARMYDVPKITKSVVRDVLNNYNYLHWSVRIKTYLLAHDLWDTIDVSTQPPKQEDDEVFFKAWTKKNLMALQVIQSLCTPDISVMIREINSAKIAWDTLEKKYNVPIGEWLRICRKEENKLKSRKEGKKKEEPKSEHRDKKKDSPFQFYHGPYIGSTSTSTGGRNKLDFGKYEELLRAVYDGDGDAVNEYLIHNVDALNAKVNPRGDIPLHIALQSGHVHIVEKLVEKMTEKDLETKNDSSGMTALSLAAAIGDAWMAECMLNKNRNLLSIRDHMNRTPLVFAMEAGNKEVARYLFDAASQEDLIREAGDTRDSTLISRLILWDDFDLALDLLRRCPHLALLPDRHGHTPLYRLAGRASAFPSGSRLIFWKKWIYACIPIDLSAHSTNEVRIDIQSPNEYQLFDQVLKITGLVRGLLHWLISNLLKLLGIRHIYETKLLHARSRELLKQMCKEIKICCGEENYMCDAIFRATREGIVEIVTEVVRANPDVLWAQDQHSRSIFSLAVLWRQAGIFSLLFGLPGKNITLSSDADSFRNSMLHLAAMPTLNLAACNTSAALRMQRELQWFKEVERITPPTVCESLNSSGQRAKEIFTIVHKEMAKEGEKWMKDTATSCMVVSALIVTVMFAVAFAVPGGNDQHIGLPIFSKKKLFILFIISDTLSLFSSSTSILMFLGILTARYAEEDFLKSLPQKMIIGLSTLFFSIATMMAAFCLSLFIMLPRLSWLVIPVICLASLPVSFFVFLQFSIFVEMFKSTYGPSIFDRKMKRWL